MTNLIRQTKKTYLKTKFTEKRQNSQKIWSLIKCQSVNDGPEHELQQLAEDSDISPQFENCGYEQVAHYNSCNFFFKENLLYCLPDCSAGGKGWKKKTFNKVYS